MRNFYLTCSIFNNTNRAVSSSEESWASVREGSYIKFGDDNAFYTVGSVSSIMYIKDFTTKDRKTLVINDNVGVNLDKNDCLQISYKEYELLTVIRPINQGAGYKVGETVFLVGGSPSVETQTGAKKLAAFKVTQTDNDGAILQIQLAERGKYIQAPALEAEVFGGSGAGASFSVEYRVLDNRAIIERSIVAVERGAANSIVSLDAPLPEGIDSGKLSVQKWELFLTANYMGESKIGAKYSLARDYTPVLGLPLLTNGNFTVSEIYNLSIQKVEAELLSIKQRLDELEKRKLII